MQTTFSLFVSAVGSVLSGCTDTEVKVELHRGSFSIVSTVIVKGLGGLSSTVLQTSRFHSTGSSRNSLTHPATPHSTSWLVTILPQTEHRWNVLSLPLSLCCISHTCSFSTRLLSRILSLHSRLSFISLSHNDRTQNWGLASPYQEARTSLTRTAGIPPWWCQMCCQMDQPWDDCCKLTTIAPMSL